MNTLKYLVVNIFNFVHTIYGSIFEFDIILWSLNKFYQYLKLATVILVVINLNIIKKAKCFYYTPSFAIDCISIFFSSVFKVYFDKFLKEFTLKIVISISLKCISSSLAIVFVIYEKF